MDITPQDHARIAAAVAQAEAGTSGEIRCVLSEGGQGPALALAVAAAASLVAPAIALLLGLDPEALAGVFGHWSVGHLAAADARVASTLSVYIALQTVIFALVFGLMSFAPLRRALTPRAVVKARVHEAALAQFAALGLADTRDRTGILIYASLDDHHAEVLADEGIYAKAPHAVWDEVIALLVDGLRRGAPADGFAAAAQKTGEILSEYLPPRADDRNELPNRLVRTGARKPRTKG
jgi:putative membrane protein